MGQIPTPADRPTFTPLAFQTNPPCTSASLRRVALVWVSWSRAKEVLLLFLWRFTMTAITRRTIKDEDRVKHTADLFGFHFPLHLEPLVYATADGLSC